MPRPWRALLAAIPAAVGIVVAISLGRAVSSRVGCITILRGGLCTHFAGQRTVLGGVLWALVPATAGLLVTLWLWRRGADR